MSLGLFFLNPFLRSVVEQYGNNKTQKDFCDRFTQLNINVQDMPKTYQNDEFWKMIVSITFNEELDAKVATEQIAQLIKRASNIEYARRHPITGYTCTDYISGQFPLEIYKHGFATREDTVAQLEKIQKNHDKDEAERSALDLKLSIAKENKELDIVPVAKINLGFAQTLSHARNAKLWTQAEVAQKLNVQLVEYKHWENPSSQSIRPKPGQIQRLNRLLDVKLPK